MADYSLDYQVHYEPTWHGCTIRFKCFDTPNSVTVYDVPDPDVVEPVLLGIRRSCLDFHRLWSFSSPSSDIARINGEARMVEVDVRTIELLYAMASFNEAESMFDFTVGPVSLAWKHAERVPSETELAEAMSHVGVARFAFRDGYVTKDDPCARVDVGGAAKGFVADHIASELRKAGIQSANIDLGGNLYLLGNHPEGRPWRLEVRIPEGVPAERIMVNVEDSSVVTSGSYERFVEIDGKRYQHIIDPHTGWPSESDIISATAIGASSLQADMLATSLCLVGSAGFFEFSMRHPDYDFIAIMADGTVMRSIS